MKNIDIINNVKTLHDYMDLKLPQKISYAISRNYNYLSAEYKIYQESLSKLMKQYSEYAEKDENGEIKFSSNGFMVLPLDKDAEFKDELADLLSIEVDVKQYKIDPESFDYDGEKYHILTGHDINILTEILCE